MIPISDGPRSRSFPFVNIALIAINFLVFFYELTLSSDGIARGGITELDRFVREWGNVPACSFDAIGWDQGGASDATICENQPVPAWTLVTSLFMHLGWLHILGNMLFLWIFGDNVEETLGHVRYAIFYLLAGVAASVTHGAVDPDSLVPALGASGAVFGVLGAYIVLFPRATVTAIIPPFFLPIPLPAFLLIAILFVFELFSGFASLGPEAAQSGSGIAYFAHIGGFVAGALAVKLFALGRPRPARQRARSKRGFW